MSFMWDIKKEIFIKVSEAINDSLKWEFNDHFDDEHFIAINGYIEDEIWMVKFHYKTKEITIVKSLNGEVSEEIEFDYSLNNDIVDLLNSLEKKIESNSRKLKKSHEIQAKTTKSENHEMQISNDEVQKVLNENIIFKKRLFVAIPILFTICISLILNDWFYTSLIFGFIAILLSLAVFGTMTSENEVRKDLFKKKNEVVQKERAEAEREKNRKEQLKKQKELEKINKEKEERRLKELEERNRLKIKSLLNSSSRIYFSSSFVSEDSDIYMIDSDNNRILEESKTTANKLYSEGFIIEDIDKTGKSAQLDSFNFVIRFSKL